LLDEVPSHLILGDLRLGVCGGSRRVGGGGSLVVVLRCVGVVRLLLVEAVLRRIVAVGDG
jgi:hypothetical protein